MRLLGESKVLVNPMLGKSNVLPFLFLMLIKRMQRWSESRGTTGGILQKKLFLKTSQHSKKITCVRVSF